MRRFGLLAVMIVAAACGDAADDAPTTTAASAPTTAAPTTLAPGTTPTTSGDAVTTTTEDDTVRVVVTVDSGEVTVTVDGSPLEGRVMIQRGATVTIELTSDVAEELHVHGYDILVAAEAGGTGTAGFVADIPGIFEVERHFAGHVRIFDLHVE